MEDLKEQRWIRGCGEAGPSQAKSSVGCPAARGESAPILSLVLAASCQTQARPGSPATPALPQASTPPSVRHSARSHAGGHPLLAHLVARPRLQLRLRWLLCPLKRVALLPASQFTYSNLLCSPGSPATPAPPPAAPAPWAPQSACGSHAQPRAPWPVLGEWKNGEHS